MFILRNQSMLQCPLLVSKLFLVLKVSVLFCSVRHINYSFFFLQPISNADFIVPVEIDGTIHQVNKAKSEFQ